MAVVTGAGLVGRIEQVSAGQSIVLLLDDPRMSVGTRIVSSQAISLIEGAGSGRLPLLEVRSDTGVVVGDIVQTSGLSESNYPPNIPIGRVVSVPDGAEASSAGEDDAGDEDDTTGTTTGGQSVLENVDPITQSWAEVEPAARLDRLNFLTVLLWVPPV